MTDGIDRTTVRITEDVGEILGVDEQEYRLTESQVVELPTENADALIEKDAAERIETFHGPPEPVEREDGTIEFLYPAVDTTRSGGPTEIDAVKLGAWVCQRCDIDIYAGVTDGELAEPHKCTGCERQGPFVHAGADDLTDEDLQAGLRAAETWMPPTGVSDDDYANLWDDVRTYLYDHWDAGDGEDTDAVYAGLTAYALSTWVRENLTFVPHLMLMGKTTGGKTRLLNTLARVSYRAVVTASATPASMFRLIDGYDVSYYISEYHGLDHDAQRELDNIIRAGQKRGEKVTRAEPTSSGHEPPVFDPFSHVAVATQYTPADDIINRCIQVQSSTANRDMPATHDEDRGRAIRDRLLYARYRLLDSDEWADAEDAAYQYLADADITGRTREKLLSLLTVVYVWDRVDEFGPFIETVVEQDREAAAESEDAFIVKAIRDAAHEQVAEVTTLGSDPYSAVTIPYETDEDAEFDGVVGRYESMTGRETSASWVGHVVKRLGFEKERTREGTVISDPDLGPKLRDLCANLNIEWDPDDIPQADAKASVWSVVKRLADHHDDRAPRDAVIDELDTVVGDRDPDHLIETALQQGDIYEPKDGYLDTM